MKKLIYTFLAVSIIFSGCEEDTPLPAANNNTNNNNSGNSTNLSIGDTHQGGIIFYLDGNGGGLIAAPTDQSTESGREWGCYETNLSGAAGIVIGTGAQNTINIEAECTTPGTAADICANLTLGGYSDWFLPSKDELNEIYFNIGQGSYDINTGGFRYGPYWSSSEIDGIFAWGQDFLLLSVNGGHQATNNKGTFANVRAIRAF